MCLILQPYRRDADIARFQASRRAGRRNAVTEDDLLPIAAKYFVRSNADEGVNCTVLGHASTTESTETTAATLPTEMSKLQFAGLHNYIS